MLRLLISVLLALAPFMFAPVVFAQASCDAFHPCPSGQACNVNGVCINIAPSGGGSNTPCSGSILCNPLGSGASLNSLLADILGLVVRIGTVVVIVMLVYVGFLFVSAKGNPAQIERAREALLWTIVGALILLGAQAIAIGIQATVQAISVGS